MKQKQCIANKRYGRVYERNVDILVHSSCFYLSFSSIDTELQQAIPRPYHSPPFPPMTLHTIYNKCKHCIRNTLCPVRSCAREQIDTRRSSIFTLGKRSVFTRSRERPGLPHCSRAVFLTLLLYFPTFTSNVCDALLCRDKPTSFHRERERGP